MRAQLWRPSCEEGGEIVSPCPLLALSDIARSNSIDLEILAQAPAQFVCWLHGRALACDGRQAECFSATPHQLSAPCLRVSHSDRVIIAPSSTDPLRANQTQSEPLAGDQGAQNAATPS